MENPFLLQMPRPAEISSETRIADSGPGYTTSGGRGKLDTLFEFTSTPWKVGSSKVRRVKVWSGFE